MLVLSQVSLLDKAAIWRQVAEDFAPFDVDVTTEEPSADIPLHRWVRVAIGGTDCECHELNGTASCHMPSIVVVVTVHHTWCLHLVWNGLYWLRRLACSICNAALTSLTSGSVLVTTGTGNNAGGLASLGQGFVEG